MKKPSIIDFHQRRNEILQHKVVKSSLDFTSTMELLNQGQVDRAISGFRELVSAYPGDATLWYNLGFALGERGLSRESIEAYLEALKVDRHFHNARFNLALELMSLNRTTEAEKQLKTLISLVPNDGDAHFELGRLYEEQGLHDFALHEYDKVARFDPDYRLIHFCRANMLFQLKRHREAAAAYTLELDRNPGFTEAHQMLKMVQEALTSKGDQSS